MTNDTRQASEGMREKVERAQRMAERHGRMIGAGRGEVTLNATESDADRTGNTLLAAIAELEGRVETAEKTISEMFQDVMRALEPDKYRDVSLLLIQVGDIVEPARPVEQPMRGRVVELIPNSNGMVGIQWDRLGTGRWPHEQLRIVERADVIADRLETAEGALKEARDASTGRLFVSGGYMCNVCDQVGDARDTINHAPDCPFAPLNPADGETGGVGC